MIKSRDNHYVPQWHQKGFMDERDDKLCHLTRLDITMPDGELKIKYVKRWFTTTQQFYKKDLYTIIFGAEINDEIERLLFGPIDNFGSESIRAFLTDEQSEWHKNFEKFFTYIGAQKLRTPKGLDWIKSRYPDLTQKQLMIEMQALRTMNCTLWAEGVKEFVSASNSDVKFILSDHPVVVYNYACSPDSDLCNYPNDPDISLKGSQTIFPLDKNRCLILTNLEYAQDPLNANPLEQRTYATRLRKSMVNTINFINTRHLTADEVTQINYIIKCNSKVSVAAGKEEWLYPEKQITCDWADLRHVLIPPTNKLLGFGGEMFMKFEDGSVLYQDAFGRKEPPNKLLNKNVNESKIQRNDACGCGSGKKYKNCCYSVPVDLRTAWDALSIRERNLAFCSCIKDVLGLKEGKTWVDVRKQITGEQLSKIYGFYSKLWPRETNIYSLLPKPDGKFRGLYTGLLDVRVISNNALPLASMFDEFLIELPITNPNIIRPEFSPITSPDKYKYQALKELLFMLNLEPFIRFGLVNLIPSPIEFDMSLLEAMKDIASGSRSEEQYYCEHDRKLCYQLSMEDLINSTAMLPRASKIEMLIREFGIDECAANECLNEIERHAEAAPLVMLQRLPAGRGGQLIQYRMAPNHEISMFTAQVTGSVLVTDSGSRWKRFISKQRNDKDIHTKSLSSILSLLSLMPMDEKFLNTFKKSAGLYSKTRNLLKLADKMVLERDYHAPQHSLLEDQVSDLMRSFDKVSETMLLKQLKISCPNGGFYDMYVQRLLTRSSCLKYDNQVRAIYGIDVPD